MSTPTKKKIRVVWAPHEGSQALAVSCPYHHILYHGSRGPGKTDAQLMAFRAQVGRGYGAYWRGIIFDRQYKNLDDLVSKSQRWFPQFNDGARFRLSKADYKWVWPGGEELLFRQIQKKEDYWNYHGQEFAFIGWNELAKFPTSELYEMMMSCNRTSFHPLHHSPNKEKPLPEIKLTVFSTTNPYGPGHNWVKRRFIEAAPPGVPVHVDCEVFDPRTQKKIVVRKSQVALFGTYRENKFLTPEYILELEKITDPAKRRAWLGGDWSVVAGGALDDVWRSECHVVPRLRIPKHLQVFRSFDWGSSKPFSTGWWAVADGQPIPLYNGSGSIRPPAGTFIRIWEYYGCKPELDNVGLMLSARDVARNIKNHEFNIFSTLGIIKRIPEGGPADSAIFAAEREGVDSIATEMAREDIRWVPANKSHGTRITGLQLVRDRLEASVKGIGPGFLFTEDCQTAIKQLPVLPRDEDEPDDVDSDAEDHAYDEIRYTALHGVDTTPTSINTRNPS